MKSNIYNNMKTISLLFIISLFINGVFGDKDDIVSVNDGGSVTLHAHLTDLKRDDVIMWRFKGDRIAKINRAVNENPDYDPDERFTDRLKMNPQNGSLTITNITSEHTGDYQLEIIISDKTITKTFSVSLSLNVKKVISKDSVSLHIDVTEKQRKDKIHWKIKHNNSLIAEIITLNGKISTHFIDERFRDRLKLNDQTGSLTITNMTKKDAGQYEADVTIGSNTHTIHKTFSYTGSEASGRFSNDEDGKSSTGLSSGVKAGICVGVLLVIVAAVVGVIYRRHKKKSQDVI